MFEEVFQSLQSHKMRTLVSVTTVAWGVFMLIVLIGTGRGLQNGVELQFSDEATNGIRIYGGITSISQQGLPREIPVSLNNDDYDFLQQEIPIIDKSSAMYTPSQSQLTAYKKHYGVFDLQGVYPDQIYIEKSSLNAGRFINDLDVEQRRKVAVIGRYVKDLLFQDSTPIGKRILIGGISYIVIGEFSDSRDKDQESIIYLPISTAQSMFTGGSTLDSIAVTLAGQSRQQSIETVDKINNILARRHRFDTEDDTAVYIINNLAEFSKFLEIFKWIGIFVGFVGAGTIFTGILAVNNIMVVSVNERTKEIGIRKAIGAKPSHIIASIVCESAVIVLFASILGLLLGIGVLEVLQSSVAENDYMYSPEIETWVAVAVLVIVLLAGLVSGYLPARKAARVNPIEALSG